MAGIVDVIQHYYRDWEPPPDRGRDWVKTLCPFHGESNPSATVNYKQNKFKCFACGAGGSMYDIIMEQERVGFAEAKRIAETVSPGSNHQVLEGSTRKSGRRVFGRPGAVVGRDSGKVPSRVRGRPTPWA